MKRFLTLSLLTTLLALTASASASSTTPQDTTVTPMYETGPTPVIIGGGTVASPCTAFISDGGMGSWPVPGVMYHTTVFWSDGGITESYSDCMPAGGPIIKDA